MHDRLLYLLANLVGLSVRATVLDGTIYEGIFHGANTEGNLGVTLKMACPVDPSTGVALLNLETVIPQVVIKPQNLLSIEAVDVDVTFADRGILSDAQGLKNLIRILVTEGFQTDTGISGGSGSLTERKLEKWVPDEATSPNVGFEAPAGSKSWDQFEVNEKLFGIKTDYQEEFYTTKLDKDSDAYKKRLREAEKLAAQIEQSTADNVHMAEERGVVIDDSQMDEEDRYGAVVRKPGSYLPPAARKAINEAVNSTKDVQPAKKPEVKPTPKPSESPKDKPDSKPSSPAPKEKTIGTLADKKDSVASKSTLNPMASSFKFNLKAAEFKPSFAPSPVSPAPKKLPERTNIFGKRVPSEKMSIKDALFKNFHAKQQKPEEEDSAWTTGSQSYEELAKASTQVYAMPIPYGYPVQAAPFQMVQQQFAPQFQQYAPPPAFMPPGQMPMQFGYQPIVYIPQQPQYIPHPQSPGNQGEGRQSDGT